MTSMHPRHFSTLVLLFLSAAPAGAQVVHPTPANLGHPTTFVVRRTDTLSGDRATDALARQLRGLRVVGRIGGEAGAGGADFGRITAIALDHSGRLLILDDQDKSISRWSATGAPLGRFGRAGGGPLEFNWPNGIDHLDDGILVVGDRQFGLKRIRWDSLPVYRDIWRSGVTYDAFCADGAGIVAYRWNEGGTVIEVIDRNGVPTAYFGVPYRDPAPFVARQLSAGRVACLQGGRIASTNLILPYVWIWERDGTPVATIGLHDFLPMRIEGSDNGGLTYSSPPEGYEVVQRIVPVGVEHFLVQLFYQDRTSLRERAEFTEVRSFLFSTRTGRGLFLGTTLPPIGAARLPLLYGWRNDPVPEVVILR